MRSYTSMLEGIYPIINQAPLKTKVFALNKDAHFRFDFRCDLYVTQISCPKEEAKQIRERFGLAKTKVHVNIIEYLDVCIETIPSVENEQFVYAVCERLPTSLESECNSRSHGPDFPEGKLMRYLLSVVSACSYLQSQGIALRNICPENMRLDRQGVLKLADFTRLKNSQLSGVIPATLSGASPYLCPEQKAQAIAGGPAGNYDIFKSDVYSLGVVMLHLSLLEIPTNEKHIPYLQQLQGRYSELWINTLRLLLTVDVDHRPDFTQLHQILFGPDFFPPPGRCFFPPPGSCDLIFLVDESGSTEGEVMSLMKSILRYICELLSPESRVALIGFTDVARVHCELTQNRTEVTEEIERLEICDETNLEVGLTAAMDLIRRRETLSFHTFLLLLTDGEHENTSFESIKPLLSIEECDRLTVHFFEMRGQVPSKQLNEMAGTQYPHSVIDYENICEIVSQVFTGFLK